MASKMSDDDKVRSVVRAFAVALMECDGDIDDMASCLAVAHAHAAILACGGDHLKARDFIAHTARSSNAQKDDALCMLSEAVHELARSGVRVIQLSCRTGEAMRDEMLAVMREHGTVFDLSASAPRVPGNEPPAKDVPE